MTIDKKTGAPYGIEPRIFKQAQGNFAEHRVNAAVTKSWHCGKPGTGINSFSITWTPGNLALSGDLGELQVVHYHAMKTWQAAVGWMANADFDYIMGKCPGVERELDREGTVRSYVLEANEQGMADWFKEHRDEVRRWWRQMREDNCAGTERHWGADPEEYGPFWEPRPTFHDTCPKITEGDFNHRTGKHRMNVPDGCELWHRLQQALAPDMDPNEIFTAIGRSVLRDALESRLDEMDKNGAYEFDYKLRGDDPSICEKYPARRMIQYLALQWWADQVKAGMTETDKIVEEVTAG